VSFQVAGHQTDHYRISTSVYEGPLDLLLELIERAELDITTLALAQVTDQYLAYLKLLEERSAAEVSAFLIIASRLLQIKSAALLPHPSIIPSTLEEEDPGEALARQLIIYKRFKELAITLTEREAHNLRTYLRVAPPFLNIETRLDLAGITIHDLAHAARYMLMSQPDLPALSKVVSRPRVTIREKIRSILESIRKVGQTTFRSLLQVQNDRLELIVTFLAMLELIKRHVVVAEQAEIFGEIQIESTGEQSEDALTADLEFTE
jgi:segregation and condensation protein A